MSMKPVYIITQGSALLSLSRFYTYCRSVKVFTQLAIIKAFMVRNC